MRERGESGMSGYAGRHRDALTGASAAAAANRRSRQVILLAAAAIAVVVVGLFAIPLILRLDDGPAPASPTVPPEAGLQVLGRLGDLADLADQRREVGPGVTATTPDGQPTETATASSSPTSPADETSPGALAAGPARTSGSTTAASGASRPAPSSTSTPPAASTTESTPRSVAKALFPAFGFADSEFGCLNAMWNRLDTWGSTAQVRPGLAYVKSHYGTPCAAWDHVRETGQY